ncbi:MAG: hypothetical protein AAF577_06490 [Pseudomonadota bacterium]
MPGRSVLTLLGLLALPLAALAPSSATAQSETWRYEPVEAGALALSCTRGDDRACALAFCGSDGRLGLGLTGWSPRGDRDRREAFVAIDGSGRPGTLSRGDTRLDGETLWQLEVDDTRVETQLERLRRGSELRIEAGRGGEPFVFGLRGSSNAIGQLEARCTRLARGDTGTGGGEITAEQIIGGIAVGVLEQLLRDNETATREAPRIERDDRQAQGNFEPDNAAPERERFRERFLESQRRRDGAERGRQDRDWPDLEVNRTRAVSLIGDFGGRARTLVFPVRTRVGRLWVEVERPRRLRTDRITAVYRSGERRNLDLDRWRESRNGRIRLPDGDLMRLEIRAEVTRGDERVEVLVTAAPPGVTPERYDRPARPDTRPVTEWVPLARRTVGRGTGRDRIDVGRDQGRFDAVGLSIDGPPVAIDSLVVEYGNGASERIEVRDTVRAGERVVLEFEAENPRRVQRMVITYAGVRGGARPEVSFWGRRIR